MKNFSDRSCREN